MHFDMLPCFCTRNNQTGQCHLVQVYIGQPQGTDRRGWQMHQNALHKSSPINEDMFLCTRFRVDCFEMLTCSSTRHKQTGQCHLLQLYMGHPQGAECRGWQMHPSTTCLEQLMLKNTQHAVQSTALLVLIANTLHSVPAIQMKVSFRMLEAGRHRHSLQ